MKALAIPLLLAGSLLSHGAEVTIPIEKYKLDNGMRVILSRDSSVPVVAVYVIYGVGARSEQKGRTGFAHLFEHMMFQGSANVPKGAHFSEVESNGGVLNGSTHPDFTDYFQILPANKLATALWLESDRMRALNITKENLDNQKEAVKQERRLSFDNRPYATAIVDRWPLLAFRNWQSSHSLIGSYEDLEAASVEDVAKFFKTYYAPNNAVLSIVGDIQIPEAKKLVAAYFGDIAPQPQPKHPDMTEPAEFTPRTEVHKDAHARVPGVVIGYPGPVRRSTDYYALNILDALLTGGESSRFQQNLVKGKQSIIQYESNLGWPFAGPSDYKDPGMYAMFLLYKPNFSGKQIVEQAQEEIARVQKEGVDAKELERVKTFVRAFRIRELQGAMARARLLGQYELFDGSAEWLNKEMDRYMAVTPAEVQAAAKKYLVPERRAVLEIVPAPKAQAPTEGR
ncbi:MAG TPA: pitrilysin family protein [Bryobacteraceae bacterium]|nr:pitrilysin family protein [Bryobacteraceae bacterium]